MSSQTQAATHVPYISKEEAAQILGVSPRRVLEFAQAGALLSQKIRNPETNLWRIEIHAGDVERMRDERTRPQQRIIVAPAPAAPAAPTHPQIAAPAAPEAETHASLRFEDLPPCAWLTLEQAAIYTGLPAAFLSAQARTSQLPALDVGVRAGGRLRFKRSDLDGITGRAPVLP